MSPVRVRAGQEPRSRAVGEPVGLRVGVAGATGALGGELLLALAESRLRVAGLRPFASEGSLGTALEFQGEEFPVALEQEGVAGLDLLFLCAPPAASLAFVRLALLAEVPCIDLSGALVGRAEVPLRVVDVAARARAATPDAATAPLIAAPDGASLALFRALQPLAAESALRRVVATLFDAASIGGRRGLDALHQESIALFNQQDLPEPEHFDRPVAFDCLPVVGELDRRGRVRPRSPPAFRAHAAVPRGRERGVLRLGDRGPGAGLRRLRRLRLARDGRADRRAARRPATPGCARSRAQRRPARADAARGTGADAVRVGRLRSAPGGFALWLVADPLRLAAVHAVALAEARLAERPDALRTRAQ